MATSAGAAGVIGPYSSFLLENCDSVLALVQKRSITFQIKYYLLPVYRNKAFGAKYKSNKRAENRGTIYTLLELPFKEPGKFSSRKDCHLLLALASPCLSYGYYNCSYLLH